MAGGMTRVKRTQPAARLPWMPLDADVFRPYEPAIPESGHVGILIHNITVR